MPQDTLAVLQAPLAQLPRPDETLGIKPKISSIDDAETALREISWCAAVSAAIAAKAEELLTEINELARKAATYSVGEEQVPVADRRKILEAELLRWGDANRAKLCPGRKKSAEFRNGKLKWREGKDSVKLLEDLAAKEAKQLVADLPITEDITVEAGPLAACLQKIVDAVNMHGAVGVTFAVNKTDATKAYQLKQITAEQLEAIGHEFDAGEEYISVEPAEFVRAGV